MASQTAARSNADADDHGPNAAAAAWTAASASAGSPTATVANVSPVDGLTASAVPPPPGRQRPPM